MLEFLSVVVVISVFIVVSLVADVSIFVVFDSSTIPFVVSSVILSFVSIVVDFINDSSDVVLASVVADFNVQLCPMNFIPLLSKHYVNWVILTEQNLS